MHHGDFEQKELKMTVLQDWTSNREQEEFDFNDFQELNNFSLAEELLPDDKKEIGNPYGDFQMKLETLCQYLFDHKKEEAGWSEAWDSLKNLADKGYPGASLMVGQVSADLSAKGDTHMASTADKYFEKAQNSPYSTQEMKDTVEMRQQNFNDSFDFSHPDLTKANEAKDFTEEEYTHLQTECDQLMWSAQSGDKNALKRLEILAERGYPQAQENCGFFALEQGDVKKAMSYLDSLRNNHDAQIDGEPLQIAHVGEGLGTALSEARVGKPKEPSFLEIANSAKNLDELDEKGQFSEMEKIHETLLRANKTDASSYTAEDVKALEVLSGKNYPHAQEYLINYYEYKEEYSKAYDVAKKMERNPVEVDGWNEEGKKYAEHYLPLARKEQALPKENDHKGKSSLITRLEQGSKEGDVSAKLVKDRMLNNR